MEGKATVGLPLLRFAKSRSNGLLAFSLSFSPKRATWTRNAREHTFPTQKKDFFFKQKSFGKIDMAFFQKIPLLSFANRKSVFLLTKKDIKALSGGLSSRLTSNRRRRGRLKQFYLDPRQDEKERFISQRLPPSLLSPAFNLRLFFCEWRASE